MASSYKPAQQPKEQQQDLRSLLTAEQIDQLTFLVVNITERMRRSIADNFDASKIPSKPLSDLLRGSSKNPNITDPDELEKARKKQQKREEELSEPKLQELKNDVIAFFHDWQESIIARMSERSEEH